MACAAMSLLLAGCGGNNISSPLPPTPPPPPPAGLSAGPAVCMGGVADDFTCSGIDLRKRVSNAELGGGTGNDLWGWVDPTTGNEYA